MQTTLRTFVTLNSRGLMTAPDHCFWRILVSCLACIGTLLSLLPIDRVYGQDQSEILVQAPDLSAFPQISLQFELPDPLEIAGVDLLPEQLHVQEDGQEVPVQSLQKEKRGIHFTLAIDGGREFDLRDAAGNSSYMKLRGVISAWAESRVEGSADEWTLIASDGKMAFNLTEHSAWLDVLWAYEPDFRGMTPDLSSLSTAIQMAETRVVPFGLDKSILYLTTPPTVSQINAIYAEAEKARAAGIQVNVWMVGDPVYLLNDQGGALIALADITGGMFFHFSGVEILPDASTLLPPQGFIYVLQYESLIRKPGTFSLQISADLAQGTYQGIPVSFYVDVRPPDPVLLDPPAAISRAGMVETPAVTSGIFAGKMGDEGLYPDLQIIKILVDFPDGSAREIIASRLIVNGVVVDERKARPFDVLSWDLSDITQSSEQTIQVEVEDSLGLSGLTNEYHVQVEVTLPEPEPVPSVRKMTLLIAGGLSGLGFLALLVWGGIRLVRQKNMTKLTRILARESLRKRASDGISSAVREPVLATLVPTGRVGQDWERQAIRISKRNGVFGENPKRADYHLEDEGVDPVQDAFDL